MPRFVFIIPARNAAATIAETVASLQAQTEPDWRAMVVDDASTDGTPQLLAHFHEADPRISWVRLAQAGGPGAARNVAMAAAPDCEFFAFIDADDVAHPQRLERHRSFFTASPAVAALGSAVQFFGAEERICRPAVDPEIVAIRLLFSAEFFMPSLTLRRDFQRQHALQFLPGTDTGEDWEFATQIVRYGQMANLPEVLLSYRRSPTQATAALCDHPTDRAARLRCAQLAWLGVPETQIDIETHIAISPSYWQLKKLISPEAYDAQRVMAWGDTLRAANRRNQRYDEGLFAQVIQSILEEVDLGSHS